MITIMMRGEKERKKEREREGEIVVLKKKYNGARVKEKIKVE